MTTDVVTAPRPGPDERDPGLELLTEKSSFASLRAELERYGVTGRVELVDGTRRNHHEGYVVERDPSGWRWGYAERGRLDVLGTSAHEAEAAAGVRAVLVGAELLPADPLGPHHPVGAVFLGHDRQVRLADLVLEVEARGLRAADVLDLDDRAEDRSSPAGPRLRARRRDDRWDLALDVGGTGSSLGSAVTEGLAGRLLRRVLVAHGVLPTDPGEAVDGRTGSLDRWAGVRSPARRSAADLHGPSVTSWTSLLAECTRRRAPVPPGAPSGDPGLGGPAGVPSAAAVAARARLVQAGVLPVDPLGPWLPGARLSTRPADQLRLTPHLLADDLLDRDVLLLDVDDLVVHGYGPEPVAAAGHGFRLRVAPVASRLRVWFLEDGAETWCGSAVGWPEVGGFLWLLLRHRGLVPPAPDPWARFRTSSEGDDGARADRSSPGRPT